MNHSSYLRVAAIAIAGVVVFALLGVPVMSAAPFALILLVCSLMMYFMMRNMGHGSGSGSRSDHGASHDHPSFPPPPPPPPARRA